MQKKNQTSNFVNDNTSVAGKLFDYLVLIFIFISLIVYALETLPDLNIEQLAILHRIEFFLIIFFTIEFFLRLWYANKPLNYIFSFYGLIDIISVLPYYLHFGFGFSSLRALRIFRIFRALKIVRYNRALIRFKIAFNIIREEIILFAILTGILLYIISAGIYHFEHIAQPKLFNSVFHSLWWAVVTLFTVGYGDSYPITVGGKIFTFFVLIIGVSMMMVPAGIFTTALMKAREIEEKEKNKENTASNHSTDKEIDEIP